MKTTSPRRCGATVLPNGSTRWSVWAPFATHVDLVLAGDDATRQISMAPEEMGYFHTTLADVHEGQLYTLRLDGGEDRPDPCSLWQPQGIPGPSAVYRPDSFRWTDASWRGIPRESLVIYELHVGTFTPKGTFDAVIPRLPALRDLGVTCIEIMPVGQFPGSRNWGYDGVLPYATQNTYGGPEGLQRLVDACHAAGLAVLLDVVYNHFGPEGNYLHEFGPYFTDRYQTPWGKAINFDDADSDAVRDFVLDNARMWLEEFHFDGLRLDAVHAIYDMSARHILRAIADVAADIQRRLARTVHIIGESDLNDPRVLHSREQGGHALGAQWSDDFHHAVHAYLTGERRGYYVDYGSGKDVARSLETPFLFAGTYSPHRRRKHGAPPDGLSGDRFVVCIQNHDQVGNRAKGERLSTLLRSSGKQRLAASLLLLSPYLPLLFMGEEYGEERPFPFFCSFLGEELIEAVRQGRKREFAELVGSGETVPDPAAVETFDSAKLSWSWPTGSLAAGIRALYADLLDARKEWPALANMTDRRVRLLPDPDSATVIELVRGGQAPDSASTLTAWFNLTDQPQPIPSDATGQPILFSSESPPYKGGRKQAGDVGNLLPHECIVRGPSGWKRYGPQE